MFHNYDGVTFVESGTQANINWVSDLIVKALCGACTILLGIAVHNLQSMSEDIKTLSNSVNALTISNTVVLENQKTANLRLDKLEADGERIKNRVTDLEFKTK